MDHSESSNSTVESSERNESSDVESSAHHDNMEPITLGTRHHPRNIQAARTRRARAIRLRHAHRPRQTILGHLQTPPRKRPCRARQTPHRTTKRPPRHLPLLRRLRLQQRRPPHPPLLLLSQVYILCETLQARVIKALVFAKFVNNLLLIGPRSKAVICTILKLVVTDLPEFPEDRTGLRSLMLTYTYLHRDWLKDCPHFVAVLMEVPELGRWILCSRDPSEVYRRPVWA
ncbi:hypothetical protein EJ05DRAFT_376043 [Pseudovirgaria hyperparasitica]|uniref:Uncharacterized protein n=1 Tax=Pseudovirgaria hyperparasitica TaxID=470096 RepID=A0A6A6W5B1_9PEZI|nr:uncharacterized protein EJ05DRAFT_376043 [Pseudovirgaria hyperparasitica]KAF2758062.1 hypothetical protein EJ05DRAFT_376043 [Pseudovirgaria hyperparasitica]